MNVLLIEDDVALGRSLVRGLEESGVRCQWSRSGAEGLRSAQEHQSDVIVLDIMLPDIGGLEVLRSLRRSGARTPVLVLSALGTIEQRVSGLQGGADDYLVKPFAFAELLARLQALSRRAIEAPSERRDVGPLSLDLALRRVMRDGIEIDLTPTEFSMLEYLMRHAGQVVTRRMLCEHLWEAAWEGVTNVVDVHVSRLRAKIDRGFDSPMLHTIRGRGYIVRIGGGPSLPDASAADPG
jgi:two-component system OmpR family response regulator/two-component system copper resistance phosphate regulon response regulator CusR